MDNSDHLDLTMDSQEEVRCKLKFREVITKYGGQTHFNDYELNALLIIHYKLTKSRPMDRKYFRRVLYKLLDFANDFIIENIFSVFDSNNMLTISMDDWILGMSTFLRGTLEERIKFCFKVYDLVGSGFIKKERIFQALKHNFRGTPYEENQEDLVIDLIDILMKKMDLDRDGMLSFEDYRQSVLNNPNLLEFMGYCFPSRSAAYAFMATFSPLVSTMYGKLAKGTCPI